MSTPSQLAWPLIVNWICNKYSPLGDAFHFLTGLRQGLVISDMSPQPSVCITLVETMPQLVSYLLRPVETTQLLLPLWVVYKCYSGQYFLQAWNINIEHFHNYFKSLKVEDTLHHWYTVTTCDKKLVFCESIKIMFIPVSVCGVRWLFVQVKRNMRDFYQLF